MTVPSPPEVGAGNSGDSDTDVGGEVVTADVVIDVVVDVVVFVPESPSPPQPVASDPAATPAASAKRTEFESMPRTVMSPVVARRPLR
jgi:hypothetical protein